jgi:arsenate reductase
MTANVERARPDDRAAIRTLLAEAKLPTEDLETAPVDFWIVRQDAHIVGAVGLERYGSCGLLRSLVVAPSSRERGLARALVGELEQEARRIGITDLALLTQTAAPLFAKLGYENIDRAKAPEPLKRSAEFKSLCPTSATCKVKRLSATPARVYNVLFLCTGNSARSILAEAILNRKSRGRFKAFSAGSHPTGKVNPGAIELLEQLRMPTAGLRSKSWDEFAQPGAPEFDFVFTVCDSAASEVCPVWPGHPMTAHWGVPDPAHVEDPSARAQAFREALRILDRRIDLFICLPLESIDELALKHKLRAIGQATA